MAYPSPPEDAPGIQEKGNLFPYLPVKAALRKYDELIGALEVCLCEARRRREVIASLDDEVPALAAGLRSVMHYAEQLEELGAPSPPETHLRIVPGDDGIATEADRSEANEPEATSTALPADTPPAPSGTEQPTSPTASAPTTAETVIIRGARMKQILSVVGSRPDEHWVSGDIADLLGIASSDRSARRALRSNLAALTERGALQRIPLEGDSRVAYKPLMNWRFV